jgi:cytochrome c nitrite reductase small subunit
VRWKVAIFISASIILGVVLDLVYISNATSYLSDDSKTCMNCHVMGPQYSTWQHSAHREVTTCNDCHTPQDSIFKHYAFKAQDGLRHSTIFTMRTEPQSIKINKAALAVVQSNCIRCHDNLIQNIDTQRKSTAVTSHGYDRLCWECHRETPHGNVRSLSSTPNAIIPVNESIIPEWIQKKLNKKNK